jgi:hypothetical protein
MKKQAKVEKPATALGSIDFFSRFTRLFDFPV